MKKIYKKICSKCKFLKDINEFSKDKNTKDGYRGWCKQCQKLYYEANKEKINEQKKEYRILNREKIKQQTKEYYILNKEKIKEYQRSDKVKNRRNERDYKRNKTDLQFNLNKRMTRALRKALKENKNGRHWESCVNYTLEDLKNHLESLFLQGMTWDRFLNGEIHIDHVKPKSLFSYTSYEDEEFKQCWSLSNLQPLWAEDNLKKGNRFEE